jgi:hypothetical protein
MSRSAVGITFAAASLLLAQSPYRITHTYSLGGDGSWDYVVPDPPNHRVFIARQNRVMVVDEDTGKLLGEVTGIQGAHGTAVAESTGHGFATSGNDESVVMFDLKSFQPLARIHAAEDADAIVYDKPSNRVFTLNGDAHSSTVIDARDGAVIANVQLGGKPRIWCVRRRWQGLRQSDGHRRSGRDRCEVRGRCAAVVYVTVQESGFHGTGYGPPPSFQWLP